MMRRRSKEKAAPAYLTSENQKIVSMLFGATYPSRKETFKNEVAYYGNWLGRDRLYVKDYRAPRHRREIGATVEQELKAWAEAHPDECLLSYFMFSPVKRCAHSLKSIFLKHNPLFVEQKSYITRRGFEEPCEKVYGKRLISLWQSVYEDEIRRYFTYDVICGYLEKNARYPFSTERKAAQEAILKEIPDTMPALFPNARTLKRHFILHIGPTNSGKTYEAIEACMHAPRGIYLAPLRLLAMEVAEKINGEGIPCNMITGEEEQMIHGAQHMAATVEMMSFAWFDVAVIDECQMIGDHERGWAWTQAVLGVTAGEVHACMAPEAASLIIELIRECGDTYEIRRHERYTPLAVEEGNFSFPEDVRDGDALVVFSRRSVLQAASLLEDEGRRVSVIYGALPYQARRAETEKFATGKTKVVVCTDAIGMGMNLPVKRIVFLEMVKFDGLRKRELTPAEIKQIAGRAGRRGYEEIGLVNALYDKEQLADKLAAPNATLYDARTTMPSSLIHMDRRLSQTMRDWQGLSDQSPYSKATLERNIHLCEWMEINCPMSKEEIYRGITIPFDETSTPLLQIWQHAMDNRYSGKLLLDKIPIVIAKPRDSLETLESKYKTLDLLYALLRSFPDEEEAEAQKEYIIECKLELSACIISKLRQNKRMYKKCKICGAHLPWNYPYRVCEDCHHRERVY